MYKSKGLQTLATMPTIRMSCTDEAGVNWLPLQQNWSNRWCTLPELYKEKYAQPIHDLETHDSDVFVVGFMKSGTTWIQELVWLLLHQLDFESARNSFISMRSHFMEFLAFSPRSISDNVTICEGVVSPRLIKTHLPAQLLPRQIWQQKRKIIYIARNPKDVVVSSFHFMNGVNQWKGDLDTFVDEFVNDKIAYTSYWSHVVDYWRMRNEPNIFFVTYEEMIRDLPDVIQRLCKFLMVENVNDNEMEQLLQHLSFKNMKSGKYSNPTALVKQIKNASEGFEFLRRGIIGSYKDELSAVHKTKMDQWTNENLKEYGIRESDIFGEL